MTSPKRQPSPHLELVTDDAASSAAARRRIAAGRIGPNARRTAHRAHRTWLSLLFIPFFVVYMVVDAVRELGDRLARRKQQDLQRRPQFQRPASMPPLHERSMEGIIEVVERFPFRTGRPNTQATFFRDNGADAIGALLSPNPQVSTLPHMYPRPFDNRLFTGADGARIAGMQAMHEHVGPALIICHGLLMTKHFDVIIQMARRVFEQWGFHVVTIDLRGWGQTSWTTDAPNSAGRHEGRDVIEIARELHRDPRVTSVAALGYSLGGASVLNAAHVSSTSDDRPLDGGAVTVSAPTRIDEALRHISTRPHWRDPYFGLYHVFQAAIRGTVRQRGLDRDINTWVDLVTETSLPYYGLSFDDYCAQSSAVNFAHEIDMPVLDLHAVDDFLVPVMHAEALAAAAADNPWVHVMVRDAGAHIAFGAADPSWFHSTMRCWFEYWATPGARRGEAGFEDFDSGGQLADEIV
ncbi:MAG: hypothetical protein JWO69_1582 [Thermoleophilia bacterium]|jgi:predicted alpha/beta-fold hydrolase|nr:hypothetical protein [Thermoleophilia bacterium]